MVGKQDGDGCLDDSCRQLVIDLHLPRWWLSAGCAAGCGGGSLENRRSSEFAIKTSKVQHLSVDNPYTFIQPININTQIIHNNKLLY
jgi:hypothetical protein